MLLSRQEFGGAHLINMNASSTDNQTLVTTESFTLCIRFYLRVLGTIEFMKRGTVIEIPGLLHLECRYPHRSVVIICSILLEMFNPHAAVCSSLDQQAGF